MEGRAGASLTPVDFTQLKNDLEGALGVASLTDRDVITAAMFPEEFENFYRFRQEFGPIDKLDTPTFFLGPDVANEIQVLVIFNFTGYVCMSVALMRQKE